MPDTPDGPFRTLARMGSESNMQQNGLKTWAKLYGKTTFTVRELEAFRHRMAHLVGCEFCAGKRSNLMIDEKDRAVPDDFYDHIFDSSWAGYTARERLIVETVERFADDPDALRDDAAFWERMRASFKEPEIVDLCLHMIAPQLGRVIMGKVLLGYSEFCEVQPAG